jgi:hypothetical protein
LSPTTITFETISDNSDEMLFSIGTGAVMKEKKNACIN